MVVIATVNEQTRVLCYGPIKKTPKQLAEDRYYLYEFLNDRGLRHCPSFGENCEEDPEWHVFCRLPLPSEEY